MRKAVFLITAAQAALLVLMAIWPDPAGMDAAGRGMGMGFLMIFAAIAALFLVPALILALKNKALNVALALSLIPPALALFSMAGKPARAALPVSAPDRRALRRFGKRPACGILNM